MPTNHFWLAFVRQVMSSDCCSYWCCLLWREKKGLEACEEAKEGEVLQKWWL